ncbi:hypothetical protein GUJ93_ZPchr0014g46556 [Zizania palustris]|uniref:Uncharacterized protein n=1 Tax=Zizania palustris TaxID=103762 RepID=A0A8J5T873_ZIZPA|nr:hypothetical protein GUJ93_ZPchr0014g46556 [Zizania palustris]
MVYWIRLNAKSSFSTSVCISLRCSVNMFFDEDENPPEGGNPHPFNGWVFPGDPAWVQHWVDEQLFNAPMQQNNGEADWDQGFVHQHNGGQDAHWAPWPMAQPQPPQIIQENEHLEDLSMDFSAVSNPSITSSEATRDKVLLATDLFQESTEYPATMWTSVGMVPGSPSARPGPMNDNGSKDTSKQTMVATGSASASLKRSDRQITLVYKRRFRRIEPKPSLGKGTTSQLLIAKPPEVVLRRSVRIKNILQGFRLESPSRHNIMQAMHVDCTQEATRKGKEVLLPAHPSLQDFINATTGGMFHTPLSIGQIQHSAIHICDIDAAQVSREKLSADPEGDAQMLPLLESAHNDKEDH